MTTTYVSSVRRVNVVPDAPPSISGEISQTSAEEDLPLFGF
jgi:hypothetical protein